MNEVSISLKALYESKEACEDVVSLEYGEIFKTEDNGLEWFDLYNKTQRLACMDGETVSCSVRENGDYKCWNDDGEALIGFKLTAEEFGIAVFK